VRASIGPFWGYVAGVMGLVESVFFLAVSMLKFGQAITATFDTPYELEFLWWALGYIVMLSYHIKGGRTLWTFLAVSTAVTMFTIFIYLLGSIAFLDFPKYAYSNAADGFTGSALDFFLVLRLPCWLFVGIDFLTLTSEEVQNVRLLRSSQFPAINDHDILSVFL
jgi:amino acid transporter